MTPFPKSRKRRRLSTKTQKGYTLIEVLVAVFVTGVLVSAVVWIYQSSVLGFQKNIERSKSYREWSFMDLELRKHLSFPIISCRVGSLSVGHPEKGTVYVHRELSKKHTWIDNIEWKCLTASLQENGKHREITWLGEGQPHRVQYHVTWRSKVSGKETVLKGSVLKKF
jgi:prepilin-type N-terminal cleavage/methylation domain-containing protein